MDKADGKNTNLIDNAFYVLVLTKLKHILVNGFYSMDEVRYIYKWDDAKLKEENLIQVRKEDAVLRYFLNIGVFGGRRFDNEFRSQELQARRLNPSARVWTSWDEEDPAYREYEWVVEIHTIDYDKFTEQLGKFHLVDTGTELVEKPVSTNELQGLIPLPPTVLKFNNKFSIHQANVISYKGQVVELEPQVRKMIAFIMERSSKGLYTSLDTIIDSCLSEQYLAKAGKSKNEDLVPNYIRRSISKARSSFRASTNSGQEKDYLPSKSGIGYIFKP